MYKTRQASTTPEQDILKVAYEGQPETSRQYQSGWETLFNELPLIDNDNVEIMLPITQTIMKRLSYSLQQNINGFNSFAKIAHLPGDKKFERTIIGMEQPTPYLENNERKYKEGAELVIAKWGKRFASPVHGHSTGYMHEEVLKGKIKVNTYRIVDMENKIVVPYKTEIIGPGVFVSGYAPHDNTHTHKRQTLIHNFEAVEPSITLHYLPEHTRDGRDNAFKVQYFTSDVSLKEDEVTRITSREGMFLKPGDVLLVRSSNVPEYGDHFVVVTGPPIMKEHGMRVQDISIEASHKDTEFLNNYEPETGLILLKLNNRAKEHFLAFHHIDVINNKVLFPII